MTVAKTMTKVTFPRPIVWSLQYALSYFTHCVSTNFYMLLSCVQLNNYISRQKILFLREWFIRN